MNIEKALREQYGPLERYVKFRIGNLQDAEDVVQDVMLTAFHRAEQLRNPDRFRPWLFQIAANACRDYYRSRKRPTENLEEVEQQLAEPARPETAVEETLAALRERDQTILRLRYLEDRNQQEIAAAMGIPVGTVKSRLHYAKAKFRAAYPYPPREKGANEMKQMPEKSLTSL